MRALASLVLAAAASAALAGAAAAAAGPSLPAVVVPIDQSTRLDIVGSAYSVLVGSPAVADVTVVDSHTLFITGRGYGSTNVVVLDAAGNTLFRGGVTVTAPETGRVSIYRGAARVDMACAPGCQVATRADAAAPAAPAASPLAPTP